MHENFCTVGTRNLGVQWVLCVCVLCVLKVGHRFKFCGFAFNSLCMLRYVSKIWVLECPGPRLGVEPTHKIHQLAMVSHHAKFSIR